MAGVNAGSADVLVAVGEGQLERLGDHVQIGGAVVPHVAKVEAFEQVERVEHGEALRVGRALVDVVAPVVDRDRRGLERLHGGQVGFGDDAAVGGHAGHQRLGHRAGVEAGRPLGGDGAQRSGEVGVGHDVAHLQRRAVAEPDLGRRRKLAELLPAAVETASQALGDRISVLGHLDGRGQHLGHRLGAVLLQRQRRAAHRAGHGNREPAVGGHAAMAGVVVDGGGFGREAGAVDELHLLGLGQVDEGEHVRTQAGHAWLDLALDGPRRHRGIHGVAAGLEHAHAHFGRQRMPRRHHALRAHHRGAPADRLSVRHLRD